MSKISTTQCIVFFLSLVVCVATSQRKDKVVESFDYTYSFYCYTEANNESCEEFEILALDEEGNPDPDGKIESYPDGEWRVSLLFSTIDGIPDPSGFTREKLPVFWPDLSLAVQESAKKVRWATELEDGTVAIYTSMLPLNLGEMLDFRLENSYLTVERIE